MFKTFPFVVWEKEGYTATAPGWVNNDWDFIFGGTLLLSMLKKNRKE